MTALWFANNALVAVLLVRLTIRRTLPWFRLILAIILVQAALLSQLDLATRGYAKAWVLTETIVVFTETATVLEFASLLLQGRLNTSLKGLRWFGIGLASVALLAAVAPLSSETGSGWQLAIGLLMRVRGYLALALFLFLAGTAIALSRQPVPVLSGIMAHGRLLGAKFLNTAIYLLGGSMFARSRFPNLANYYLAVGTAIYLIWIIALWHAPLEPTNLNIDPESSSEATSDYEAFRDRVRTFRS